MEDPYKNQSMTSCGSNPYAQSMTGGGSNDSSRQIAEQRRQENRREELNDLEKLQANFGEVSDDFLNAKINQIDFRIKQSNKMIISKYYRKHLDFSFLIGSFLILVASFVLSFFTIYTAVSPVVIVVLMYFYNKNKFVKKHLKDADLDDSEKNIITNNIFKNQIKYKTIFILSGILVIINLIVFYYSTNIFLDDSFLRNFKIYYFNFLVENELFAYSVLLSIFTFIFLKIIEKLKK